jgi:hypothetical protein
LTVQVFMLASSEHEIALSKQAAHGDGAGVARDPDGDR